MTTTTARPSLEEVLVLARQLRPADQARLVAQLVPHLAALLDASSHEAATEADPRERLAQVREAFRAQGPVSPSMAEDLAASRR
jgi:uncharacterized protein (DUF2267 family)